MRAAPQNGPMTSAPAPCRSSCRSGSSKRYANLPDRGRRGGEPVRRFRIDERRDHLSYPCMVGVEPSDLVVTEQVAIDQRAIDRRQGQRLETQCIALAA